MHANVKPSWAKVLATLVCSLLVACSQGNDPEPPPPSEGSATLSAAGGTVTGPDGVQLVVPADSLVGAVTLRISRDATGAPELIGINAVSPVYAVTPHGQAFGTGALFSIPMSAAQLPAGATPILLKAEPGGTWRVMPNASTDPTRMAADIGGLSYFVIGTCSAVPAQGFTIGAVGCPSNHALRLTMFDGQNNPVQILRGPNGVQLPLWYVTDTPQTRTFVVSWARPPGTIRTDSVAVVGFPGGFNSTGFVATGFNPAVVDVSTDFSRTFTVTIDPARVSGAAGLNGKLLRVKASASYTTTALRVGVGNVATGFEFETDIPILVRFNGTVPTITQQPANLGVTEGQPASFSVAATGGTLTYQWARRANSSAAFADISGATAAGYAIAATQLADDGAQFQVQVCSAPTRCVTSSPATLTVTLAPVAPAFSAQPADVAVAAGQTASFSATASGMPLPQIKWQSAAPGSSSFGDVTSVAACGTTNPPGSGTNVTASCTVGPLTVADNGQRYRAVAINAAAPAGLASTVATLTVAAAPMPPVITQQPAAQSTTVGGSATFSVTASGTAPLNYTWATINGGQLPSTNGNFTIGSCSGDISYSNGRATITLSNLTISCSGFTVIVTVSNGVNPAATSSNATLTVNPVAQALSLLAGAIGGGGALDGAGVDARVQTSADWGAAFDAAGNAYFNDGILGRVRKISPSGVVSTLTGTGTEFRGNDGGIAVDGSGNIYFPERSLGNRILRMTPQGAVSVWLDGADGWANFIRGIAVDAAGNLYGTETDNGGSPLRMVKITPARVVSTFYTFADTATSIGALAVDATGNLYGAGRGTLAGTVVHITPAGVLSIVAGAAGESGNVDGSGAAARFAGIAGLAIGPGGDLFATDSPNRSVRRITPAGSVTTVAGARVDSPPVDGAGTAARYENPGAIAAAPNGDLLIGDGQTFRRLSPGATAGSFFTSTFVGKSLSSGNTDATGGAARFVGPLGVALDAAGNAYVGDPFTFIRKLTNSGVVTTLSTIRPRWLARDVNGDLVAASDNAVWRVTLGGVATLLAGNPAEFGYVDAAGSAARFGAIGGLAVDSAGQVFVTERTNQNSTIRRITPAGVVSTWAGVPGDFFAGNGSTDGPRLTARFASPGALAFDRSDNLFVADGNRTIRRITPAGDVSTVAGVAGVQPSTTDGTGAAVRFTEMGPLAFDNSGNLLIADLGTLRRMTPAGAVTTVMGVPGQAAVRLGNQPRLNRIGGLAVRPNGLVVLTSEAAVLEATLP